MRTGRAATASRTVPVRAVRGGGQGGQGGQGQAYGQPGPQNPYQS